MIPGIGLYKLATSVIGTQQVQYYRFLNRATNSVGYDAANYADPVLIRGSLQAASWNQLQYLGLDLQKEYINFYTDHDILNVERDTSGDQLAYQGKRYQVIGKPSDWVRQDGWNGMLCVRVYD